MDNIEQAWQRADTDWFHDARWGIFCHYLGAAPSTAGGAELTAEEWNRMVDGVDVDYLASQVESTGAGYFFLTLGQNSGHFCAPNAAYDDFVGIKPSKCSRRDLVVDLHAALTRRGIPLLVYLPSGAPAADPVAVERLGWEWGYEGGWPHGWAGQRTGKRLAEFQLKWETVIREWSVRWGERVRGWWIDGCYFADEMYRHPDPPNFRSFAATLKAGNSASIVAFNPGVKTPVICLTEYEDYTAGEISTALPEPPGRWVKEAQYHLLSYLGSTWCQGEPRFSDELVTAYTRYVNAKDGVVTWDVPITREGRIPQPFIDQLARLGAISGAAHSV